jgi:hypothetical protein
MAYIPGPFGNIWVPDLPSLPQLPNPFPGLLPQLPSPSDVFGAVGSGLNAVAGQFGLPQLPVPQGTNQTTITTYGPGGQPVTGNVALGNKFVTDEEFGPFAQALARRVQALEAANYQQAYAGASGGDSTMMLMMVLLLGSGTGTGTGTLDTTTLLILVMLMGDKGGMGGGFGGGDNSTMMLMMVLLLGGSI